MLIDYDYDTLFRLRRSMEIPTAPACAWWNRRVCYTEGACGDVCDLASTLCKYDLRKGDLFVLSWARVRRVRRGSISSELIMCGVGVRSILLLPLVVRCVETIPLIKIVFYYPWSVEGCCIFV